MEEDDVSTLDSYYRGAATWSDDRQKALNRSERRSWLIAGIAASIALLEAIAIVMLMPLKTVVPYTLLVDRQTGYVQALRPLERDTIAPEAALTRSFLAQYVIAREGFNINSLRDDYHKVALWSAGEARSYYVASMQANNPVSPLATLPRRALIDVQLRSISPLAADTALVRFSTARTDSGPQASSRHDWVAIIKYHFSNASMAMSERLLNPIGFQVDRYVRNPETLPEPQFSPPPPTDVPSSSPAEPADRRASQVGEASP